MSAQVLAFLWDRAGARVPRLSLAALLSLASIAAGTALLATSGYLIQQAATRPPILSLTVATVGVRLFSLLRAGARYLDRLATHDAVLRLLEDTRVGVYAAVEPRSPAGFDRDRSGDVMRRLSGDVDALQDFHARSLLPPLAALLALVVAVVIMSLLSATLAATAGVVTAAAAAAVILGSALPARGAAERLATLSGTFVAEVTDVLQGCADLIGVGALDRHLARIGRLDAEIRRTALRLSWARAAAAGLVSLATGLVVLAAVVGGILAVQAGAVPAITVGIVALAAMALSEPFALLPAAVDGARSGMAAGRRLVDITTRPLPVREPAAPRHLPTDGTVELRDVVMRYAPEQPAALDRVSLRLERGRRVGIVGPSGSGKSTLASVLVRFRELESGSYTLGGVDVHELRSDDVRRRVGLVAQDAYIFATSIRENLRLASPEATDAGLQEAARRANLLAWIETLPDGWDTRVGEHGAHISGGQRRRLALARALLARAPVLVVDEPTEALDAATAESVMADVLDATRDSALLVISHRDADMRSMDEVLVMEGGRLSPRAHGGGAGHLQRRPDRSRPASPAAS
jgi:ATP-binding cassette, subfamily C, bacterial CydCD